MNIKEDVFRDWFMEGIYRGARYVIIIYDELECIERPIFVFPEQNIQMEVIRQIESNMVKVINVMDLLQDRDEQIKIITLPIVKITSEVVN